MKLYHFQAEVHKKIKGKKFVQKIPISVVHNIENIDNVFHHWIANPNRAFSSETLVEYLKDKEPDKKVFTKKEFDFLNT